MLLVIELFHPDAHPKYHLAKPETDCSSIFELKLLFWPNKNEITITPNVNNGSLVDRLIRTVSSFEFRRSSAGFRASIQSTAQLNRRVTMLKSYLELPKSSCLRTALYSRRFCCTNAKDSAVLSKIQP